MAQQAPRTQVACNGQIISEIVIRSHAPSYGGLFERSVVLGRLVTWMHVATAPSVIRNFVQLKEGAPCSSFLRRVEITTVDEPSVIA